MKTTLQGLLLLLALQLLGQPTASAQQTAYKFINVADTNGPFSSFDEDSFSINSAGTVAFSAPLKAGGRGIFKAAEGEPYTKIVQTGDQLPYNTQTQTRPVAQLGTSAFINHLGDVSFNATFSELNEGVYISQGSGTPLLGAQNYYSSLTGPSINGQSKIAWTGFFGLTSTGGFDSSRYYVLRSPAAGESGSQGTAGAIIAHTGGNDNITGFFSGFGTASINDGGTVAFRANIRSGGEGIWVGKEALPDRFGPGDAKTTLIANNISAGTPFSDFGRSTLRPEINNLNIVAFGANLKNGGHGIFKVFSGGGLSTVVDNSGSYRTVLLNPAINSSGEVLFSAVRIDGRAGIYKGPDPEKDVVVETGASLFGSTLQGVRTGPRTLADNGKVAFFYQLIDGRRGLAVAIPNGEKKPTGDLVIKESTEPASAYTSYGLYTANAIGTPQLREVTIAEKIGTEALFDVELTNNATEEETYILFGSENGSSGWKIEALAGTFDNWPALKSGGASIKMQPGAKLSLKMRLSGSDTTTVLPRGSKRSFNLSVRTASDHSFTHDSVGANVLVDVPIVVNMTGDQPDASDSDGVPDVDLDKDGLQTTLRCALEYIRGRSGGDVIKFKIPPEDPGMANGVAVIKPKTPLPHVTTPVTIDGSTQDPASATPTIQLDGSDLPRARGPQNLYDNFPLEFQYQAMVNPPDGASGLAIDAEQCKVRGLSIIRFPVCGVELRGAHNSVYGCHLGIDAKGKVGGANGAGDWQQSDPRGSFVLGAGIIIRSSFNRIGGTAPRDRNVISGTSGAPITNDPEVNVDLAPPGIVITGPGETVVGNEVVGNYFGLDASGEALPQLAPLALPTSHSLADIVIHDARGNLIGGTAPGSANFFAHHGIGVLLLGQNATSNLILGNQFGRSASGAHEFDKSRAVMIENARSNQIGGPQPGASNRILSAFQGVLFSGLAQSNQCIGNDIRGSYGAWFERSAFSTRDEGPSENWIEANDISSGLVGIEVLGATTNTIKGNSIHGGLLAGVRVKQGTRIRITENQIYGIGKLGITLSETGKPVLNDVGDADGGGNEKQNFPDFARPLTSPGSFRVEGSLYSQPGRVYQLEFFANSARNVPGSGYGEGQRFIGAAITTADSEGLATFSISRNYDVQPGEWITATATDSDGNTSEFSRAVLVHSGNDADRDGVDDEVESGVPNRGAQSTAGNRARVPGDDAPDRGDGELASPGSVNEGFGDGNGDGVLDSQQTNVASFQTISGAWVTLVSPAGTTLEEIVPGGPPEFDHLPAGFTFPVGFLSFSVGGVVPGGPVAVTCILHDRLPAATAFGYGPLPGMQPGWYQFNFDGQTGAALDGGELVFNFVDGARGDHDLQGNGRVTTLLGPALSGQLLNIATRLRVQTGESVLIGGFIITGTDSKKVLIRGIGPSLAQFFNGTLSDPVLQLFQGNTQLASNNDWREGEAEIAATGIPPGHDRESAIVYTLAPGSYTAVLQGNGGSTGIGVVEVYDLDQKTNSKLANIASRGFVDSGDNVMIGGLIVGPAGGTTAKVVVRAIGPSLANFGIAGALQDPTLELVNSNGVVLRGNDSWQDSQQAEIEATGLQPGDLREAVLVETVAPGNYTAIVRGAGGSTGVGLVEVYNIQ